jgi:hypothetical protein
MMTRPRNDDSNKPMPWRALRATGTALLVASVAACSAGDGTEDASTEGAVTGLTSTYTELGNLSTCRQVKEADDKVFEGKWDCGGMGGFAFLTTAADGRDYPAIRTPQGGEIDLNLGSIFGGFSHYGPKVEWRGTFVSSGQVKPSTVIFRYFQSNPETGGDGDNFLMVAKVTNNSACVYAKVDGKQANANEKAREEAAKVDSIECPSAAPATGEVSSQYTSIDRSNAACKKAALEYETSWNCGGTSGYSFVQSWSPSTIGGPERPFVQLQTGLTRTWTYVYDDQNTPSSLGPNAEWRGIVTGPGKVNPFALIYRYIRDWKDASGTLRHHHSLVVVKVRPDSSCVHSIIDATKFDSDANERARRAADAARNGECPFEAPSLPPLAP